MAATTQPLSRTLQLQFQVGTTATGAPKLKNYNFPRVSESISDDDLLAVAEALGALFADPVYQIARVDQTGLESA